MIVMSSSIVCSHDIGEVDSDGAVIASSISIVMSVARPTATILLLLPSILTVVISCVAEAIILVLLLLLSLTAAALATEIIIVRMRVATGRLPLLTLPGVAEHLVRALDLFKLLSCLPSCFVGVILLSHFIIRKLDFLLSCPLFDL